MLDFVFQRTVKNDEAEEFEREVEAASRGAKSMQLTHEGARGAA